MAQDFSTAHGRVGAAEADLRDAEALVAAATAVLIGVMHQRTAAQASFEKAEADRALVLARWQRCVHCKQWLIPMDLEDHANGSLHFDTDARSCGEDTGTWATPPSALGAVA
jgi:hypothetical protein